MKQNKYAEFLGYSFNAFASKNLHTPNPIFPDSQISRVSDIQTATLEPKECMEATGIRSPQPCALGKQGHTDFVRNFVIPILCNSNY